MNNFIKYLLINLSLIFIIDSTSAQTKFVNVTGRAVIIDNTPALSRKVALEDALYLAALEGGAIISGYSALDAQTNLSEEIIVRPASGILDYTIVNEVVSDQHYEVSIKALIGPSDLRSGCQARPSVRLIAFLPSYYISETAPPWSQNLAPNMFKEIISKVSSEKNVELINAVNTDVNSNFKNLNSNNYNYNSLTGSVTEVKPADFALETNIIVDIIQHPHKTKISNSTLEDYLSVSINLIITDPITGEIVYETNRNGLSFIGPRKTIFRSINVLSSPNKKNIASSLMNIINDLSSEISKVLICKPLKAIAKSSKIDQSLTINLGTSQGITVGKLALAESQNTPFAVFEVVETSVSSSRLIPLDKKRAVGSYYGKVLTFMEFTK